MAYQIAVFVVFFGKVLIGSRLPVKLHAIRVQFIQP